ncbi:ABC transporter ATP-binding protein [Gorillibacterium timonense]|uniref:ABC transporter ATP-binding protein n=1 Tax=Gorillibacterium timonense TaxID=1689269 RepID=UPI00071C8F45|nr:ABC transporter ATP-binding protein [Gorillibacterium timonense]
MIRVNEATLRLGDREVLRSLNLTVEDGCFYGIIGPNGGGKSTLLRLLSGVLRPDSGAVEIDGRAAADYPRKELARKLAVLPQEGVAAPGFTVREVLEMGRYPYQDWFGQEPNDPSALLAVVMERLSLNALADREIDSLSGGERQRVALGKTMVQEPRLLLLDEPTTFLDIGHQVELMDYIREWQTASKLTVVAVLHDLNLAAQYCDRLLLLHDGRSEGEGAPSELIDADRIERVYGTRPLVLAHPVSGVPQLLLQAAGGKDRR